MNVFRLLLITTVMLGVTACHKDKTLPEPKAEEPAGVIPQAQLDALNKAKNVENVMMQDAQRQREQADQQGQ
jgi:hypothetical protein